MAADLNDLSAFVTVARAGGFRDAARLSGVSASSLSEAVRRLEAKLGVRLLNRTTRSIAPTEAGARLIERLTPALGEVEAALDVVNAFRDRPAGTLKLNVPANGCASGVAVDRGAVPEGLSRHPAGGHRRGRLRRRAGGWMRCRGPLRRAARAGHDRGSDRAARSSASWRPLRPAISISEDGPSTRATCSPMRASAGRFASGATPPWEFEREGEVVRIDPQRTARGAAWRGDGSRDRRGRRRARNRLSV